MHVHSYFSGPCTSPAFLGPICRECYSKPQEVYELLDRRGMGLFTLTDHDEIEGSEALRGRPGFFLSEELTCRMPSGTTVHIGVYDFDERQHEQLLRRRNDLIALLMYLTERRLFFSINHVFSGLTGKRTVEDFCWFQKYFPAMETRNGQLLEGPNAHTAELARRWKKIGIGGSDAHALPSVGLTYTEVPGARDKEEFFAGLRSGMGRVGGESGRFAKLTGDVLLIALGLMRERSWTTAMAPLALLIPPIIFLHYREEREFTRRWAAHILGQPERRKRPRWIAVPQTAPQAAMGE
jgi:predicted metal-dependent phosphoesterase TrpH